MSEKREENAYGKKQIRDVLEKLCSWREYQLAHKQIPTSGDNGYNRRHAIQHIRSYLAVWAKKDDQTHINMLVICARDILTLMPGSSSSFGQLREKLKYLLKYAIQHHSLNPQSNCLKQTV